MLTKGNEDKKEKTKKTEVQSRGDPYIGSQSLLSRPPSHDKKQGIGKRVKSSNDLLIIKKTIFTSFKVS